MAATNLAGSDMVSRPNLLWRVVERVELAQANVAAKGRSEQASVEFDLGTRGRPAGRSATLDVALPT